MRLGPIAQSKRSLMGRPVLTHSVFVRRGSGEPIDPEGTTRMNFNRCSETGPRHVERHIRPAVRHCTVPAMRRTLALRGSAIIMDRSLLCLEFF